VARALPALRFGLTPVFLTSDLELLSRLQGYLEQACGRPVELVQRRTYQEITALLISGQLEAAWICGYPYVANRDRLELVAVPLWRGEPLYRSYILVAADRQGGRFEDLEGDIHAFSDPDSNSGFLVTRSLLAERRLNPDQFFRKHFFTYGHRNVVRAVATGLADSGSVDGYVWEVMTELEPALTDATRVLLQSPPLGFPPIAAARQLAASEAVLSLQQALLTMGGDPLGQSVLAMLRLDAFVVGYDQLFDGIAQRLALVRSTA
jgi:phosphonate transport system substrate-binding protein